MTIRDRKDIKRLYIFHNYLPATIAKLYGLSRKRISIVLHEDTLLFNTGIECILCGNEEDIQPYYINGEEIDNRPQNIIMLCEPDKRRITHLQLRRKTAVLKHQD